METRSISCDMTRKEYFWIFFGDVSAALYTLIFKHTLQEIAVDGPKRIKKCRGISRRKPY